MYYQKMITYNNKIKKERLIAIINNIDDDGEKLKSNRKPVLKVFGLPSTITSVPTSPSDITIIPDSRFIELIRFELFRPSFTFVSYTNNLIKLSVPLVDNTITGVIKNTGRIYFARIFNAKINAEAVMQLDVGDEKSNESMKIFGLSQNLQIMNENEFLYINSSYIFEQ